MKISGFFLIVASIVISGCYGSNHITLDFAHSPVYSKDSANIVFFAFIDAWKPAKGIAAFPDGGIPKRLFTSLSLFQFNRNSSQLSKVYEFHSLPYSNRTRWITEVNIIGDSIIFRISPISGWDWNMKKIRQIDSVLFNKYENWFVYNSLSSIISRADTIDTDKFMGINVSTTKLRQLTAHVTWKEWGIDLNQVFPASRNSRVNELVELQGNQTYRDALVEHMAPVLSGKDIRQIIDKMNKYVSSQSDYQIMLLENSRNNTISKLQSLLKQPNI